MDVRLLGPHRARCHRHGHRRDQPVAAALAVALTPGASPGNIDTPPVCLIPPLHNVERGTGGEDAEGVMAVTSRTPFPSKRGYLRVARTTGRVDDDGLRHTARRPATRRLPAPPGR